MKKGAKIIICYILAFGVMVLVAMGINMFFNNQTIETEGYISVSHATWLTGHVEYTSYSTGHQDVKIYPGLGHRLFDSILYQDLDGDCRVDIIRRNGPEWKCNKLDLLLIRDSDFDLNKEDFIEADKILRDLKTKYNNC